MSRGLAAFLQRSFRFWRTEGAAPWQQVHDLLFFRRVTGMSPGEFHRYQLWDRRRSIQARLAYLSHEEHRILEKRVNPAAAVRALNDKIATAERLTAAGIPMPRLLGEIEGMSPEGGARTGAQISAALQQIIATGLPHGVVIKPNRGQGGHDVEVFLEADDSGLLRPDGTRVTIEALAAVLANRPVARWKVEERLAPHPVTAQFAPESLATMRVLTFRSPDGSVHVGPASLKLPIDAQGVDNFGAGNLAAPVDLATGRLGTAVRAYDLERVDVHPRGPRITGVVVPEIQGVVALATAAARALDELTVLGWDVALTPEGPRILEGNAWWSELILQKPQGEGIVTGRFAELLEEHGLGELLRRRERAVEEWRRSHPK